MSDRNDRILVGISQGDVNGIGWEVILKAFSDNRLLETCVPVIYGSRKVANAYKKIFELEHLNLNYINEPQEARSKKLNMISSGDEDIELEIGVSNEIGGNAAFNSLDMAINDLKAGKIQALVTAPINKKNIQREGFSFPGHTEYLSSKDDGNEALMFMVSERLKVGVVTGHIPLREVADKISQEQILEKLTIMNETLKWDFNVGKPKIAVLGLNPHAGDNGLLGSEEIDIINVAVEAAQSQKILAYGPYPADGFFGSNQYMQYDAVLAMYHDQGLIPFKALSFGEGINYTAGLSFVRTSPDHGTGYAIAGKNQADESSFRLALYTAIDIYKNRSLNQDLKLNSMKSGLSRNSRNSRGNSERTPSNSKEIIENQE